MQQNTNILQVNGLSKYFGGLAAVSNCTLNIKKGSKILDLACGIGRHSIYLEKIGFKVVGTDKSSNNIKY